MLFVFQVIPAFRKSAIYRLKTKGLTLRIDMVARAANVDKLDRGMALRL